MEVLLQLIFFLFQLYTCFFRWTNRVTFPRVSYSRYQQPLSTRPAASSATSHPTTFDQSHGVAPPRWLPLRVGRTKREVLKTYIATSMCFFHAYIWIYIYIIIYGYVIVFNAWKIQTNYNYNRDIRYFHQKMLYVYTLHIIPTWY